MFFYFREQQEKILQKRKARAAFREYARNGWESPWIRKNRLLESIFFR